MHMSDTTFNMSTNQMEVHQNHAEPWLVTLVDTGADTLTGGRLKRVSKYLEGEKIFCFTYGDGLSDVDIKATVKFHLESGLDATVTAVNPPGRYGALDVDHGHVKSFIEKPAGGGMINGGFFVLNPSVIELIEGDQTSWEEEPLRRLSEMGQLGAYIHDGFWQPMDTLREKNMLEELWCAGGAPWRSW